MQDYNNSIAYVLELRHVCLSHGMFSKWLIFMSSSLLHIEYDLIFMSSFLLHIENDHQFNALMQDCSNSIADTLELLPLMCYWLVLKQDSALEPDPWQLLDYLLNLCCVLC